jgi:hypothetical protein
VRKKARPRRFLCYQQRSRERYVRVPTPAQEERRRNTEDRRNISPAPLVRGEACRQFLGVDKHAGGPATCLGCGSYSTTMGAGVMPANTPLLKRP